MTQFVKSGKPEGEDVLIVEDSPTQAEKLKFLLEKNDFKVTTAGNGMEALNIISKRKPFFVITDVVMPEMNGYELCRNIKENKKFNDIPVILLTALSDPMDVIKGLECGADNFITKPYEEKYLLSRIRYMLANKLVDEGDEKQVGSEIFFEDTKYHITAQKKQILNLLISTYETAIWKNIELKKIQDELDKLKEQFEKKTAEVEELKKKLASR